MNEDIEEAENVAVKYTAKLDELKILLTTEYSKLLEGVIFGGETVNRIPY